MHYSQQFSGNDYASSKVRNSGAVLTGHFGIEEDPEMHSEFYIDKATLFSEPQTVFSLGRQLKDCLLRPDDIEIIVAPPPFGLFVALPLGIEMSCRVVHIEEHQNKLFVRRGSRRFIDGRKVLAVDSISISGGKLQTVSKLTEMLGGEVVERAVLIDRGASHPAYAAMNDRPTSLLRANLRIFHRSECPGCIAGTELSKEFGLASKTHGMMVEDSFGGRLR